MLLALLVVACGSATGTAAPTERPDGASADPTGQVSDDPGPSDATSPDPEASEPDVSDDPSVTPVDSTEPQPSVALEPATDCTGTAENRTFYSSVAAAVTWTVYCPVLPSGWFVETGQYRLSDGGRLSITYRGPGDAHFTLSEGVWCDEPTCVPAQSDLGAAAFGDRGGNLVTTGSGGYAIVVDAGSPVSWALVGDGLDEGVVRMIGAALIAVGD